MHPCRPLARVLLVAGLALAPARPAHAQDTDNGSVGGAVVGAVAGGVAGLLGAYPLAGCPIAVLGASRPRDYCDVASVGLGLGGLAAGGVVGGLDARAGYGMGIGLLAGFGTGLLLGKVVDAPRWVDSALILAGVVAGGILGSRNAGAGENAPPVAQASVPLWSFPVSLP